MTSNINPNNINGAYPVAGQDNNSQGFRDNFTNTATNFQYAAEEITELQNKAILKEALTGTTIDNDMQGSPLSNAVLSNMSEELVALGTVSGSVTINYALASYQTLTASAPVTLAFSNFPAAGTVGSVTVQVTVSNVSQTLTLPASVGAGNSATNRNNIAGINTGTNTITFPATGTYVYQFWTSDQGSTVYINDLTQPRPNFTTISVTGNVTANNVSVSNKLTSNLQISPPNYTTITGSGTYSLAQGHSLIILNVNNTGYTATLNMPASPVEGQIVNFGVFGNAVTLVAGAGTVTPTYAGLQSPGSSFKYVYSTVSSTWYKIL